MIDGSKKCNRQLAFELQNSHVCEKHSNAFKSALLNQLLLLFCLIFTLSGCPENSLIYGHPLKYTPPTPLFKKLFEDVYKKVITEGCRTEYQIF